MDQNTVYIAKSTIHGNGVFAKIPFKKGETIFVVTDMKDFYARKDYITPMGKMVNHQLKGNCVLELIDGKYVLCADKDIVVGTELTANYKILPPAIYRTRVDGYNEL